MFKGMGATSLPILFDLSHFPLRSTEKEEFDKLLWQTLLSEKKEKHEGLWLVRLSGLLYPTCYVLLNFTAMGPKKIKETLCRSIVIIQTKLNVVNKKANLFLP